MAAGSEWIDSGKVFTAEDGSALNPERLTDWFHELTTEAGSAPIACTICATARPR